MAQLNASDPAVSASLQPARTQLQASVRAFVASRDSPDQAPSVEYFALMTALLENPAARTQLGKLAAEADAVASEHSRNRAELRDKRVLARIKQIAGRLGARAPEFERQAAGASTAGDGVLAAASDANSYARRRSRLDKAPARAEPDIPSPLDPRVTPEQRARLRAAFEPFFIEWARKNRAELSPDLLVRGSAVAGVPAPLWEEWEAELARTLARAGGTLRQNWRRSIDGQPSDPAIKELSFKGRSYPVIASLGGSMEANVYLVRSGSDEMVLKVFHPASRWGMETYRMNVKALEVLKENKAPVVQVLDQDAAMKTVKLSFERGFVRRGARTLYEKSSITEQQFLAFNYFSTLHTIIFKDRYSNAINPHLNPVYFNPMEENILYDPWTSRWIILDPF